MIFKNLFKMAVLIAFSCYLLTSCKKENPYVEMSKKNSTDDNVSVEQLKGYMAELLHTEVEYVSYDLKADEFSLHGVPQISKKELSKIYSINASK
jgi:hypothetical protein